MSSPAPANETNSSLAQRLSQNLEPFTRLGAMVLVLTYASGFLVVNIHHAQFGIAELSLLKVRVLAAGVLFVFLTMLPIITAARIFGMFGLDALRAVAIRHRPEDRAVQQFTLAVGMYMACFSLALATTSLFEDGPWGPPWPWAIVASLFVFLAPALGKFFSDHPRRWAAFTAVAMMGFGWAGFFAFGRSLFVRSL